MKIILLRHGRPEIDLIERQHECVSGFELKELIENYRWIGLAEKQDIPDAVKIMAQQCTVCITSDISRSIESAQHIVGDNIFSSDSIFREAEMPYLTWRWPKVSMKYWFYFLRCLWLVGYAKNGESFFDARQNAKVGAEQLIEYAQQHNTVLLVGHGINIYFIAKELVAQGWAGKIGCNKDYWNFNQFVFE